MRAMLSELHLPATPYFSSVCGTTHTRYQYMYGAVNNTVTSGNHIATIVALTHVVWQIRADTGPETTVYVCWKVHRFDTSS
jgi:hypothetical protein